MATNIGTLAQDVLRGVGLRPRGTATPAGGGTLMPAPELTPAQMLDVMSALHTTQDPAAVSRFFLDQEQQIDPAAVARMIQGLRGPMVSPRFRQMPRTLNDFQPLFHQARVPGDFEPATAGEVAAYAELQRQMNLPISNTYRPGLLPPPKFYGGDTAALGPLNQALPIGGR